MSFVPPAPAADTRAAAWLHAALDAGRDARARHDDGRYWVPYTVGAGFEAYARIFHPCGDEPGARRWADVAVANGRTMHASAQWEDMCSPDPPPEDLYRFPRGDDDPDIGNLQLRPLSALCDVLRPHTAAPETCWFAMWDGWGWMHQSASYGAVSVRADAPAVPGFGPAPAQWQLDLDAAARIERPTRTYLLFTGPLEAATRTGHWLGRSAFDQQCPSLFWPDNHAWCVATEIDFDSTLVGGSRDAIDAVLACPALEAWPIEPDAPYFDLVNT